MDALGASYVVTVDVGSPVGDLKHFWRSTGFWWVTKSIIIIIIITKKKKTFSEETGVVNAAPFTFSINHSQID